jgi:hypothetical protein
MRVGHRLPRTCDAGIAGSITKLTSCATNVGTLLLVTGVNGLPL